MVGMATASRTLVIGGALWALAGCGSSHPQARTSAPASTVSAAGVASEASKSPRQILADAAAALDDQRSFHVQMTGNFASAGGPARLSADVAMPGRIRLRIGIRAKAVEAVVIGDNSYLKANTAFWRGQVPSAAVARIADRWIGTATHALPGFATVLNASNPAIAGQCLLLNHVGMLGKGGTTTLEGKPVIVIVDRGRVPGSTPNKIFVAATGPPLPVAGVQTGLQVPGGKPDRTCGETKSDVSDKSTQQRFTISNYNAPVNITPPTTVINIPPAAGASVS